MLKASEYNVYLSNASIVNTVVVVTLVVWVVYYIPTTETTSPFEDR